MSTPTKSLALSSALCACTSTAVKNANTDLIDAQYAAYNAKNIDTFMSFYAPDARLCSLPANTCFEGEEQIRAHFAKLFTRMSKLEASVSKRTVDQDYVLDWENVIVVNEKGKLLKLSGISVYQVESGKIKSLTIFMHSNT